MANKTIDALVFCPFYMSEAPLSITCEGIVGEATVSKFPTKKKKEERQRRSSFLYELTVFRSRP